MSPMEWKLELVPIPVSDVDAAKRFYVEQMGFTLDHDVRRTRTSASCSSRLRAPPARSASARES
jgi:catechol 2,3-dioxygenase-like lactoylglutathione lyase family enzyme